MYISNATGCSSIWGGTASISPYTVNKDSGHGPAWCNSLFEDNAEHGLGLYIGQKTIRENLIKEIAEVAGSDKASAELKAAYEQFIATKNNTKANDEPAKALIAELEKAAAAGCEKSAEILKSKQYIAKKSVWIFGGDGWAYDIGFGGVDHVLASGKDVNVFVFDTEVYSNTGGQCSKSTPRAAVAKFATTGKPGVKKDLGLMAMTYGNVYVASVALGAKDEHTLKAFVEAEAYDGPAIIIAYSHCISHGINMAKGLQQQKAWVDSGRILLYRYNPDLALQGKNPLIVEGKGPKGDLRDVLLSENRFKLLAKTNKEGFEKLLEEAQKDVWHRWNLYQSIANMGADKSAE